MNSQADDATEDGPGAVAALRRQLAEQEAAAAAREAALAAALRERTVELRESIEYQTATADVLKVISRSTFDLQPVLGMVAATAARLCNADQASICRVDGDKMYLAANFGFPAAYEAAYAELGRFRIDPGSPMAIHRAVVERRAVHVPDAATVPGYTDRVLKLGRVRTALSVPLLREGDPVGVIALARQRVEPFTDQQIELVQAFADQGVIAIENTRLLTETREALEQQTATAEVLGVINASPENLGPVFQTMLDRAMHLCGAAFGELHTYDGTRFHTVALHGVPEAFAEHRRRHSLGSGPGSASRRMLDGEDVIHVPDLMAEEVYRRGDPSRRAIVDLGGARSAVAVAMRKDGRLIGAINIYRPEVGPYNDRQIAVLENFAAQAVIAMENARLITETREALEQQTATAEVLGVINSHPGDLAPVFEALMEKAMHLCGAIMGELFTFDGENFIPAAILGAPAAHVLDREETINAHDPESVPMRLRAGESLVHITDLIETDVYRRGHSGRHSLVHRVGARALLAVSLRKDDTLLGFIQIMRRETMPFSARQVALLENFAAQAVIAMENARLLNEIRTARDEAETTLADLRRTQDRLVQTEKMASLGQLTAGIAHEIKNPLNFVNNFSDLSVDLLDELTEILAPIEPSLDSKQRADLTDVTETLQSNLRKITEHGKRADSIVKNMLLHSRTGASERRETDLNATAEEALNLAYHGARAETPGFNITLERDFDPGVGQVTIYPQEIARVLVNLINNGFYAAHKRAQQAPGIEPTLRLSTKNLGDQVEIRVRDNGTGIPAEVREKIFEPFFTTKPAGEGTGLGLSLSFDIVVKQHNGQLSVASEPGSYTEFTITLPRNP